MLRGNNALFVKDCPCCCVPPVFIEYGDIVMVNQPAYLSQEYTWMCSKGRRLFVNSQLVAPVGSTLFARPSTLSYRFFGGVEFLVPFSPHGGHMFTSKRTKKLCACKLLQGAQGVYLIIPECLPGVIMGQQSHIITVYCDRVTERGQLS